MQKLAGWIETSAQKIGDFATAEIPPFIHEYLTWKFYENLSYVSVGSCVLICLTTLYVILFRKTKNLSDSDRIITLALLTSVYAAFFAIIFQGSIFKPGKEMIQIKVAPKVYLMERASDILKK